MARVWVGCGQVRTVGLGSLCGRRARKVEGEVVAREEGWMGDPPTRARKIYDSGRAAGEGLRPAPRGTRRGPRCQPSNVRPIRGRGM